MNIYQIKSCAATVTRTILQPHQLFNKKNLCTQSSPVNSNIPAGSLLESWDGSLSALVEESQGLLVSMELDLYRK